MENFLPYMTPMERALKAAQDSIQKNKRRIKKEYEEDGLEYDEGHIDTMLRRDVDAAEFFDPATPNNAVAAAEPIGNETSTKKPAVAKTPAIVKKPAPDAAVAKKRSKRLKKFEATPSTTAAKKPTAKTNGDEEELEDEDVDEEGGHGRFKIAAAAWIVGGKRVKMEDDEE